ncbi:MAG: TIGR02444 family protein [Halioglobus sp.]|nr:TIGR02444 family protein [Halioglobus sp.]
MENPLWVYSLEQYKIDGVSTTCLRLQDDFAMDVNLLLYAGWLAQQQLRLTSAHLSELNALVADWRDGVICPIRALRRQLRGYPAAAVIRGEIRALELRSEQQQQAMMYDYYQRNTALAREQHTLASNLSRVACFSYPADCSWQNTIDRLAELLLP